MIEMQMLYRIRGGNFTPNFITSSSLDKQNQRVVCYASVKKVAVPMPYQSMQSFL